MRTSLDMSPRRTPPNASLRWEAGFVARLVDEAITEFQAAPAGLCVATETLRSVFRARRSGRWAFERDPGEGSEGVGS